MEKRKEPKGLDDKIEKKNLTEETGREIENTQNKDGKHRKKSNTRTRPMNNGCEGWKKRTTRKRGKMLERRKRRQGNGGRRRGVRERERDRDRERDRELFGPQRSFMMSMQCRFDGSC